MARGVGLDLVTEKFQSQFQGTFLYIKVQNRAFLAHLAIIPRPSLAKSYSKSWAMYYSLHQMKMCFALCCFMCQIIVYVVFYGTKLGLCGIGYGK